ncbi:hypothetical protein WA026_008335 [Henosepilachna vigintioctopunctata]|uniref:Uncharacterized protein n=1 Tax=Henosepilachna vigintioctopunctata TaxID=420089 RepID=A0AAW1UH45_9CUCU
MVSVPASPPESKSRKVPTACIAKNQESTVREEASTSCATPKSSFGSTSTEKCSPIHEINAATVREEASTSCATPESSFGSTSTEKCSTIHEINAATLREEASTSCVTPESSFGSTSTEKCSTIHEIDAAKIAFMFQLSLVTHEEHHIVSVPASPPESKSRKEPTACIAKNQESTVREEASTSCATPKSSFGSTSTEKCSPIHEINAATVREEASTSCAIPESSFGSTSTEKCSTIHEIDAAKIAFMFQLSLVTHEEHHMVSVPASPPESKSRKEPTACIAKNQESTVREEASTSSATPKSSFGSTSTEKCSPIHEINAATVREEA